MMNFSKSLFIWGHPSVRGGSREPVPVLPGRSLANPFFLGINPLSCHAEDEFGIFRQAILDLSTQVLGIRTLVCLFSGMTIQSTPDGKMGWEQRLQRPPKKPEVHQRIQILENLRKLIVFQQMSQMDKARTWSLIQGFTGSLVLEKDYWVAFRLGALSTGTVLTPEGQ